MEKFCKKIIMAACVSLLLTSCTTRVTPETSVRTYEVNDVGQLTNALSPTFARLGYITDKAKLEKTTNTNTSHSKKAESTIYEYGPASLPHNGSFYRCMKLANVKISNETGTSFYFVELQAVSVTCYKSIGKVNFEVETDTSIYENFFNAFSKTVGKEGKKVGSSR